MYVSNFSKTKKIAFSGIIIALYVVIMYFTASFAFGAYQIRIATALYALSYAFPFLVLPLSLANMLSNILSGQIFDIIGGFFIGLLTSGAICLLRRIPSKWGSMLIVPIIIILPAFIVPIWLSAILALPYFALVASLLVGQTVPAVVGYLIVTIIIQRIAQVKVYKPRKKGKTLDKQDDFELSDSNEIEDNLNNIEYSNEIKIATNIRTFEDEEDAEEDDSEEIL